MSKFRANYRVDSVDDLKIEITDLNGDKSVTNDAENVTQELFNKYGNKRIFYIDTMGNRDEILHENGKFISFFVRRGNSITTVKYEP